MRTRILCALALASSSPALASDLWTHAMLGESFTDAWSSELPLGGAFERTVAGEVTGNALSDVVVLAGRQAYVLVDPERAYAPVQLPLDAADAAVLEGHCADGRGALAVVGAGGLSLIEYVAASATFQVHATSAGSWAGAQRVVVADLGSGARSDLLAIAADGRTVLTRLATGAEFAFIDGPSFVAAAPVLDVLPLQWISGGEDELAILTTAGVFVHDATTGAPLAAYASVQPGGSIARITQAGHATDRLTWITPYSQGARQWMFTLSPAGVGGQLDLGTLDVVATVGGDFDNDGDDDVLLSHRNSYELVYVENQRSPAQPAVTSFVLTPESTRFVEVGPSGTTAPENRATPAVADFDDDGDLDVVFPCQRAGTVRYVRGDLVDQELLLADVLEAGFDYFTETLSLQLDAPAAIGGADELVFEVRVRASVDAPLDSLDVARVVVPWPTSWPTGVDVPLPGMGTLGSNAVYVVEARALTHDAQDSLVDSQPFMVGAFSTDPVVVSVLQSRAHALATVVVEFENVLEDPSSNTSSGLVRVSRTSRYRPNQPPLSSAAVAIE